MRSYAALVALCGLLLVAPATAQEASPAAAAPAEPVAAETAATTPATTAEVAAAATPAPAPATASASPVLDRADLDAWLDGFLPYALERGDIPGAVVVIVKDGQVLLQKRLRLCRRQGSASPSIRKPPCSARARSPSSSPGPRSCSWSSRASSTSTPTSTSTSTSRSRRVDGEPVTLRHIMTHTSGLEETVARADHQRSGAAAAARRSRSSTGCPTASSRRAPRRPTRTTRPRWPATSSSACPACPSTTTSTRTCFAAAGHAAFDLPPAAAGGAAAADVEGLQVGAATKPQPYELVEPAPAGSLAASGADMGRFMIAHLADGAFGTARILREETARQMHGTASQLLPPLNSMMLGFYETDINGHRAIAHGGDTQWFHSDLNLFLDEGIGIYISMNSAGKEGAAGVIRNELFERFANRYLPGPDRRGRGRRGDRQGARTRSRRPLRGQPPLRHRLRRAGRTRGPGADHRQRGRHAEPADGARRQRPAAQVARDRARTCGATSRATTASRSRSRTAASRASRRAFAAIMVFEPVPWWKSVGLVAAGLRHRPRRAAADRAGVAGVGAGAPLLRHAVPLAGHATRARTGSCASPRWPWWW